MGWTSKSYSFTLMTDAHAGEQEAIDDAIADGFLKEIEKLADKINKYRSREIVFLSWEREEASIQLGGKINGNSSRQNSLTLGTIPRRKNLAIHRRRILRNA